MKMPINPNSSIASDSLHGVDSPLSMAEKENTPLSAKLFKTGKYTKSYIEQRSLLSRDLSFGF